ncbi:MAG TPA: molybdate transporter family protein [Solirubrobacterales bacterium]|nr:molybdate transporter family protein [Solirubrobacterales bacterium]
MGSRRTRLREWTHELGGGLGDAGLLIPLAVALIALNGLSATAVFAGVGIAYVGTALYFKVPVPVQPLKAFAAAAIALQLDATTIAAGALLMAAAMALLAGTGLAGWLAARFPIVLVRGIQASVALLLASAAIELAQRGNWEGLPTIDPAIGVAMAVVACGTLLACRRSWRVPGSLAVLAAGAGIGLIVSGAPAGVGVGPEAVAVAVPDGGAFVTALTALVIAQIPLTFGNSVVATVDAERSYFGDRARRVTAGRLAGSIAVWNTAAGLTAGLPVCHGAGGVTAHYRLGARTAYATAAAGAIFLVLGFTLGDSLPMLLQLLVPGALAGMLLFVAIQHAMLAARLERLDERVIVAGVGLVTLFSGNLAVGFGAGVTVLLARRAWRAAADQRPVRAH